jgi:hypothetical protein
MAVQNTLKSLQRGLFAVTLVLAFHQESTAGVIIIRKQHCNKYLCSDFYGYFRTQWRAWPEVGTACADADVPAVPAAAPEQLSAPTPLAPSPYGSVPPTLPAPTEGPAPQ